MLPAKPILAAVPESLMLGARAGVPLDFMVGVLSGTGADSYRLRDTFGRRVANRGLEPGFSIHLDYRRVICIAVAVFAVAVFAAGAFRRPAASSRRSR